jgi:prolyl-tRNA synthetase
LERCSNEKVCGFVCDAGEDIIYIDEEKKIALNKEVYEDEVIKDLGLDKSNLKQEKSIEVGNIFKLGTRFSESLGLYFIDEEGQRKPVVMGCYGIGPGRLMGTIVEALSDEKGMVWPESVAPFKVHLLSLGNDPKVLFYCDSLYEKLKSLGIETLYDDREVRAGEKFADSDLFGIPYRVVVSEKTLKDNVLEVKKRQEENADMMAEIDFLKMF